jgi:hypothetical protein
MRHEPLVEVPPTRDEITCARLSTGGMLIIVDYTDVFCDRQYILCHSLFIFVELLIVIDAKSVYVL